MQVKSIAECSKGEHSAILSTFIKLPFVMKIFVLSIFEWSLKTGFTVLDQRFSLWNLGPNKVHELYSKLKNRKVFCNIENWFIFKIHLFNKQADIVIF